MDELNLNALEQIPIPEGLDGRQELRHLDRREEIRNKRGGGFLDEVH